MLPAMKHRRLLSTAGIGLAITLSATLARLSAQGPPTPGAQFDSAILLNAGRMLADGRRVFRFDTFGDEAFWGDTLKLHQAIEGSKFGGVGAGVSPKQA